ncbi:carbohydrate ABC transporter permease [Cohnella hongkongensis]|uniref:Carbohydrate ABC transporter permease n=1 Tax=Cohnella hongkongensis TaxID=178337 RepID=A0ABV9FM07_9BACL
MRLAKEHATFYLLISPWLIGLLCFVIGPVAASFVIGFYQWDLISPAKFVGFRNYTDMLFHDELFWQSLRVTIIYAFFRVPLSLAAALLLALLMNKRLPGIGLFRTIYYMPTVISGVAVSMLWVWMFNPQFGIVNALLEKLNIQGPGWFTDPKLALPTLILISLYHVGSTAVIFLAGLKNIPPHLYEAADLDGAGSVKKLFFITIPQLTPTILFNSIMLLITSFQAFTEALIITNGGPVNKTLFFNFYLYQNAFSYSKLGYASALAWVLMLIILLLSIVTLRTSRRWVYYEGGDSR